MGFVFRRIEGRGRGVGGGMRFALAANRDEGGECHCRGCAEEGGADVWRLRWRRAEIVDIFSLGIGRGRFNVSLRLDYSSPSSRWRRASF